MTTFQKASGDKDIVADKYKGLRFTAEFPNSERRPGIEVIAKQIAQQNPMRPRSWVMTQAKVEWHKQKGVTRNDNDHTKQDH